MRTTLTAAVEGLADMVGDYLTGTCTTIGGAAGATLIDGRLKDKSRNTDDYFNDKVIWVTAGTSVAGDERYISDFTATSGTVTPYLAFTAQVPNASTYMLFSLWTASDYRRALNQAIDDAYPYVARNFVDETLETQDDVWSYRLGDYGTATYTSVSLTDTSKKWQTDQFKGLTAISGASSGLISGNTPTVLTLTGWTPSTPTSADAYQIIHPIEEVLNVAYQQDSTYTTRPYVNVPFEMLDHEGIRILQLLAYPPPDCPLRIVGRGRATHWTSTVTSVSEISQPDMKLVSYLAAYNLFSRTPSMSASQDRDFYESEAQRYYGLWERERSRRKTLRGPTHIWHSGMGMAGAGDDIAYLAASDTP
jgi:hypothetical protein